MAEELVYCPACRNEMVFIAYSRADCLSPIYWCQGCGSLKYLVEGENRITETGKTWKRITEEENSQGECGDNKNKR